MTKLMFLWHPESAEPCAALAERARSELGRRLRGSGADEILLHVTVRPPPRLSLVPFLRRPVVMISIRRRDDTPASSLAGEVKGRLSGLGGALAGYRVEEAVPVARPQGTGGGGNVPGVCLLTLLRKNPSLDRDAFFREWYGRHTPMSLEIHPLMGYVRNEVVETVVPGSPPWDGIVTEDFREPADLLCPLRLFGGPLRALPNMARVGLHIRKFLDLRTLENYLVSELPLEG
jgi:hypothetical protein